MTAYPPASAEQVEHFRAHGWVAVEDVIDLDELDELERHCDELIARKNELAFDWAWKEGEAREERQFRIVQSSPRLIWPEVDRCRFRSWAAEFGSALLGKDVEFWYDQFLGKPPHNDAPTYWHQDEGYWGRNLLGRGITSWIPMQDVDATNGCMHFIDGSHHDGVLEHRGVEGMASDLLHCSPDESRAVVVPLRRGGVTFHHSATVHMTTANTTDRWRKALTQHMQVPGSGGEGDHYPWKFWVDQRTGTTHVPDDRR